MDWQYWLAYWFNECIDVAGTIIAGLLLAWILDYKEVRAKTKAAAMPLMCNISNIIGRLS